MGKKKNKMTEGDLRVREGKLFGGGVNKQKTARKKEGGKQKKELRQEHHGKKLESGHKRKVIILIPRNQTVKAEKELATRERVGEGKRSQEKTTNRGKKSGQKGGSKSHSPSKKEKF